MTTASIDITAGGNLSVPFNTFFTATIKNYTKGIQKNFLEYRAIVAVMFDKYKHTDTAGGKLLQRSAGYGFNPNVKLFTGDQTFNQSPTETALPLIYQWYYLGCGVSTTRTEQAENRGKVALFNILESRIDQTMRSMTTDMGTILYSDGNVPSLGGPAPPGLAAMISTTPATDLSPLPLGGLSSATNNWWRNNAYTGCGSFAANGVGGTTQDLFYRAYSAATDGGKRYPKVILTDNLLAEYYNHTLTGLVRYINLDGGERGDLTFRGEDGGSGQKIRGLYYEGIPWVWDRQCPAGRAYMFDPEDMYVMTDPSMFFEWTDPLQWPNQLAMGKIVSLRFATCADVRMFSVVLDGWTA